MRRYLVVLLCIILGICLVACATQNLPNSPTNEGESEGNATVNTGDSEDDTSIVSPTDSDEEQSNGDTEHSDPQPASTDTTEPEQGNQDEEQGEGGQAGNQGTNEVTLASISATCSKAQRAGSAICAQDISVVATYSDGSTANVTGFTLDMPYASYHSETAHTTVRYTHDGKTVTCKMAYTLLQKQAKESNTVYFTNNNGWGAVYAYVWRSQDNKEYKSWPGEACQSVGNNEYGQGVWQYTAASIYDRIIFNDGGSNQTHDLMLSAGTDGYYIDDSTTAGTYAYGKQDKGSVETIQLASPMTGTPQKTVYVYKPAGYSDQKIYKLLVCYDGQNLFELRKGAAGVSAHTWQVDEAIAALGADVVVLGINNAEGSDIRDTQLTMSLAFGQLTALGTADYGKFDEGCLEKTAQWVVDTLLPYAAQHYSISTAREDTWVAGSSSGGLAALYTGLAYKERFGAICTLSPASGLFYCDAWQRFLANVDVDTPQYMYLYCGYDSTDDLENILYNAKGQDNSIAAADKLQGLLVDAGYTSRGKLDIVWWKGAIHREECWRLTIAQFLATVVE